MSVSNIASSSLLDYTKPPAGPDKIRADFQSLGTALQSSDLESAQAAFAQLQTDAPWLAQSLNGQSTASSGSTSGNNLSTLASALQSGDLGGAQKAFTALQQSGLPGRHHHHHGGDSGTESKSGLGQEMQSFATALFSGDLSGAQNAFSLLQQLGQSQSGTTGNGDSSSTDNFATLATALQSGDLQGAQDAFTSFLQARRQQDSLPIYSAAGATGSSAMGGDLINMIA